MKRRELLALLGSYVVGGASQPQAQPRTHYRIGFLFAGTIAARPQVQEFWNTLQSLGYVVGKNLEIDTREARGMARLPSLAAELVEGHPDLVVAVTTPAVAAAKDATSTIPIIMAVVSNPVGSGFVRSLAEPNTNITGPSHYLEGLVGKQMQLLKEVIPTMDQLGILWNPKDPINVKQTSTAAEIAPALKIRAKMLPVSSEMDFTKSFEIVLQERLNAVLVLADAITFDHRRDIIAFSIRSRVPTFHSYPEEAFDGAFAAYGPSLGDQYRRAAYYVDKVLKGALPSSLPVDQPTRFEFVINMNTAHSIGIAIPPQFLARVDKLID